MKRMAPPADEILPIKTRISITGGADDVQITAIQMSQTAD